MRATALLLVVLAQAASQPTFKSGVNLVEVDVVVTDKAGQPVRGLRVEDFEVTEDGKTVSVETFTAIDLPAAPPGAVVAAADRSGVSLASNDQQDEGRILLIVMDDYHVSFDAGRVAASRAIARRLVERMGPWDQAAVISTSGRSSAQAEFTSDKARLIAAIDKFFPQSEVGARSGIEGRSPAMGGGRFNYIQEIKARWAMDALSNAAKTLAFIPHRRKAVLLVSQGLPVSVEEIVTNQNAAGASQALRDFIVTAQRSNIAVYTMDPCGLDLDDGCNTSSRQNLESLAENTGGFAVTNTNAPERSVDRVVAENGTYYLLGYASPTPNDGKRHRIRVRTRVPGVEVRARDGYYSPRGPVRTIEGPVSVDSLISAPIQSRGLTMRVAAVPAPLAQKPGATVAVGIAMTSADAVRAGTIDFSLVAVDTEGKIRTRQRFQSSFSAQNQQRQPEDSLRVARGRSARAISDSSGGRCGERRDRQRLHGSGRAGLRRRRSRSAAFRSRRPRPPPRSLPSCSPTCCRSCRWHRRSSRPAPRSWRSFPFASAAGQAGHSPSTRSWRAVARHHSHSIRPHPTSSRSRRQGARSTRSLCRPTSRRGTIGSSSRQRSVGRRRAGR